MWLILHRLNSSSVKLENWPAHASFPFFLVDYISSVCRSTHFHLRNIGRIRHLLSHHATAQLIHALISTSLDYCNSVLFILPTSSILRLQRIQNQAAHISTRTPRRYHITELLMHLHWLKIKERIVYKMYIFKYGNSDKKLMCGGKQNRKDHFFFNTKKWLMTYTTIVLIYNLC